MDINYIYFFITLIISYVLGSIPFGILIGKHFKGIDITKIGSGNIGTANSFRALGPVFGSLVFLGDVGKGVLSCLIASSFVKEPVTPYAVILCGFLAILGHNNSIFLKFKGGKGIATSLGVIIFLDYKIALICFALWAVIVFITKYSSLGSIIGTICLPIFMYFFKKPLPYTVFTVIIAVFAVYKHKENIKRLLKGEELKINQKIK